MRKTWKSLSVILSLMVTLSVSAENLESFNKRFKIKRDEQGNLQSVKVRGIAAKFKLGSYLRVVKDNLVAEIEQMKLKGYEQSLQSSLNELYDPSLGLVGEQEENIRSLRESIVNLESINPNKLFKDVWSKGVLSKFEFDLREALRMLDLSIIANPNNPKFFYNKKIAYTVVDQALKFAKKKLSNVPLLNVVSFIIVRVNELMMEQRLFHQNMLLHYVQNFPASELGLNDKEVDLILSSIYESRIQLVNIGESRSAAANWNKYGADKFFTLLRAANNKLRRATQTMDNVDRVNYSFTKATLEKQGKVILNLVDNMHSFSRKMSIAFYFEKPKKVATIRSLIELGQLGLSFIKLPGWLKSQVNNFADSYYVKQKLTEGALVGYFESNNNFMMADQIRKSNINPYLQ